MSDIPVTLGTLLNATTGAVDAGYTQNTSPSPINSAQLNANLVALVTTGLSILLPGGLGAIVGTAGQGAAGVGLGISVGGVFTGATAADKVSSGLSALGAVAGVVASNPFVPPQARLGALLAQGVLTAISGAISRDPTLVNDLISDLTQAADWLGESVSDGMQAISDILGTTPDPLVKTIRYVDPLILDLDGDGLEITPLSRGVLFDANGDYGDAILAQSGSYTRVDSAGVASTGQAGSFILAQNNFVRQFVPITVSAAAQALPNIAGSGWVRDLQEAATQSPVLIDLLHNVQNASTRAGYKDAVATLLRTWGNDSGYASASDQALANGYGLILSDPLDAQEVGWMDVAIKGSAAARDTFRAALSTTDLTKFDAMRERMVGGLERVHAYERTKCTKNRRYRVHSCLCNFRLGWRTNERNRSSKYLPTQIS